MIERLQRALEHIEELSPETQQDLAQQIEAMTTPAEVSPLFSNEPADNTVPESVRVALALGGSWSDLQSDDEFIAPDQIRHQNAPTPPAEEQLAWLNDTEPDRESTH